MKTDNFNVSIKIFITICIIGLILWILIPESGHYLGASSITYVFLLAVGSDKPILLVLGLSWIVFYIINLVIWFVLAIKCSKPLPFLVVVGVDVYGKLEIQ